MSELKIEYICEDGTPRVLKRSEFRFVVDCPECGGASDCEVCDDKGYVGTDVTIGYGANAD